LSKFKITLLERRAMEEKDTEKKTYEEPTLVRHEELADITEGGAPAAGSGVAPRQPG
jgi:hypothetical protein